MNNTGGSLNMATNVNLDNKLTTLKQVKSALAERDFNINELNEDLQNVKIRL